MVGTLFVTFFTAFDFTDQVKGSLGIFAALAARVVEQVRQRKEQNLELVGNIRRQLSKTWQQRDPVSTLDQTLIDILYQAKSQIFQGVSVSATVYAYNSERGFTKGATIGPLSDYLKENRPRTDLGTALYAI